MAVRLQRLNCIAAFLLVLISIQFPSPSSALITGNDFNPPFPKAISDLKERVVKGLGFQSEDIKIFGFDLRDALVGKSVAYEFDVQIDNKVLPLKLLEDVKRWEYVDLPIFRVEEDVERLREEKGLVEVQKLDHQMPVLAPFQLAGPMELWIHDAADMRISLPHDVDAGILKKVILADGAVVTVKGARSVGLRHPVELPLPFNGSNNTFASGLLTLSEHLRRSSSSQSGSLLSLRIVGPTSLTSPTSSSPSSSNRLKLKRLAPGLVELSSASKREAMKADAISTIDLQEEATALLTPDRFTTLWPLVSINGSNSNLLGFEALLSSVLGPRANKNGTFKLLKADVSAQTFLKMNFGVERKIKEGDGVWESFPEWRTKPKSLRTHFEVLATIDGNKVVPERVEHVDPVMGEDVIAPSVLLGNMTMSRMPVVYPPPNPFLL